MAALILALRSADGSAIALPYTLSPGPGIYQPDPAALFVAWSNVAPFALKSGSQFRANGPPALSSEEYAADYNDVKSVGALNSATRTPDQTEAALFWTAENAQITWNNIARIAAADHQNSLSENARLFALLNLAIADTSIAVMDTKYTYNFWRPREAIHAGEADGNADTIADPTWTPLNYIGVHPDYNSQHAAVGGTAAKVFARFFEADDFSFMITTIGAPGGVFRSYDSFSQGVGPTSGPWKPSNYDALGCSFRLNGNLWENQTLQAAADAVYNLAGKKESWVPNPSLFIMVHEPPAFVYGDSGSKFLFHWHYARGATTLPLGQLKQDNQRFLSPILFVDGHASKHDFTKAIRDDPLHPLEPTANWIWYKPKQ